MQLNREEGEDRQKATNCTVCNLKIFHSQKKFFSEPAIFLYVEKRKPIYNI